MRHMGARQIQRGGAIVCFSGDMEVGFFKYQSDDSSNKGMVVYDKGFLRMMSPLPEVLVGFIFNAHKL